MFTLRKFAILDRDRKVVESIIEHDLDNGQPCDVYPDLVPYMVDITKLDPQPEVGWKYNKHTFESLPDPATVLEDSMHAYLSSKYKPEMREYLMLVYSDPDSTDEERDAAKAAGKWVRKIVKHYTKLIKKLKNGETLAPEETDWNALFDNEDPGIGLPEVE